ncbi:ornithine aminotransferase [Sphingobacteriaceae bacterium]|nr:ornithine aminotransferase [Sphingobacteriaceae bacterium]
MKTDFEIQQDVMAELLWEPALDGTQIGVAVNQGVVMLSGVVDTYYKKVVAEKATKKLSGVKAVAEEIKVVVPGSKTRSDVDIAKAVLNALKWNSTVDESKIKVQVENAEVTLEGEAEWNFQKSSAQKAVENLESVSRITNNIRVTNKVIAEDVKHKIASAFQRHASLDANKITVEVLGDKVILTGTVRSYAEKRDAELTVWSSPGVMSIENRLELSSEIPVY